MKQAGVADEAPEYWITLADLLVCLLVVILLLLVSTITKLQRVQTDLLTEQRSRQRAIADLGREVANLGVSAAFDTTTGTVTISSEVLFPFDDDALNPEAAQAVAGIATTFLPRAIENPAIGPQLANVMVEGHTDTVGTFLYNLDLSQRRAFAVMRQIITATDTLACAQKVRDLVIASGRSESTPIRRDGALDAAASRRIELGLRFKSSNRAGAAIDSLLAGREAVHGDTN